MAAGSRRRPGRPIPAPCRPLSCRLPSKPIRRARGRRRDFYRCLALDIARHHRAVVMEPLDLKASGRAFDASTGQWSVFSHHSRAGRVVAALHELEQAIRWACARCGTAVFEIKGLTTSTCAVCGEFGAAAMPETSLRGRCRHCRAEHDRHANAASAAWRHTRKGLEARARSRRARSESQGGWRQALNCMAREPSAIAGASYWRHRHCLCRVRVSCWPPDG